MQGRERGAPDLAPHGISDRDGRPALTPGLGEVAGAWPLGASLAAAIAARGLGAGRRRAALNEALHELRRPLQALALAFPAAAPGASSQADGSLQLVATALDRLEREINGEPATSAQAPVFVRPLLASAASHWRPRVALGGGSLQLSERCADAVVIGDRTRLAQALDNLLANAIEHGGSQIALETEYEEGLLRIAVRDQGPAHRPGRRPAGARELATRLAGRHRHGHGLRVVRRVASEHGGAFELRHLEHGAEAVLRLPLHRLDGVPR